MTILGQTCSKRGTGDAPAMSDPTWWTKALQLEQADQLEAAEQLLRSSINDLGCFSQIAYLYELRMRRKQAEGDRAAAEAAFRKSAAWMRFMASGATSGGEGEALSQAAADHEAELVKQLGCRPAAP